MLIDLLAPSNQGSYNIKVAARVGLYASVYISALIDINEKALRKNKMEDGFFTVDRKYLEERTTLTKKQQKEIESKLIDFKILKQGSNENKLSIDVVLLASLLMDDDEKFIADVRSAVDITKNMNKKSKQEYSLQSVKNKIKTDVMELHTAYEEWLDAISEKFGYVNSKLLLEAEQQVDSYANHDLDIALAVLNIATSYGWRDISWAIKRHSEGSQQNIVHSNIGEVKVELVDEEF